MVYVSDRAKTEPVAFVEQRGVSEGVLQVV